MSSTAQRRTELGDFLRARRARAPRADPSLPMRNRSGGVGLRREEVAVLAGISVTWYTWLEQGREINPSRQVLDAVARTLALTDAEHAYVLSLAGYSGVRAVGPSATAPAHVQRLLDALGGSPSFAMTEDWTIAAWNRAYAALYPNVATVDPDDRNLLLLVFTDPYVRDLLPNWTVDSRRFLAEFRAEVGPRLGEPAVTALVARLRSQSHDFAAGWDEHGIEGFTSRERLFHHGVVGELRLEHHRLTPSDHPDLSVVVYTPMPDTDAAAQLRELVGR